MRFGAVFPTTEIGDDPIAVRDYAQAAEALGCVRLTAYDHVLGVDHADRDPMLRGPYTQHDPFHEPFVLFGFLAAHTSASSWPPACSSCPSARRRSSPSRRPRSTCSPAGASSSASARGGTTSSTRRSA